MLSSERLEMSSKEEEKVNALIESYADDGESVSVTRADPNESGPLLVSIGDDTWRVSDARTTKLKED